jgi:hypothetical protein
MQLTGRIQNGVVVFDTPPVLPEGTLVSVVVQSSPTIHVSSRPTRVEFPLVYSNSSGNIDLTNERIAEILNEEELDSLNR